MFNIVTKRALNDSVTLMEVEAPLIAKKARAGQFIIYRVDEFGERVPLTIADTDPDKGTVTIIFQTVGSSTKKLSMLEEGDTIADFAGPLGMPTEIPEGTRRACVVGGGLGCAISYPQAKILHREGCRVDIIAGFRSKEFVMLEEEMRSCSDNLYITTDDGTCGERGFVTTRLQNLIDAGEQYDLVIAIGPIIMMKMVTEITRRHGIKTIVSLNPIMVDGTGMCGGCRVKVDGKTKFACVDGPDFDAFSVDFDGLLKRNGLYREQEHEAMDHICRLTGEVAHE